MVNFNSTIFRTIKDEATGATKSIGLFGKSFSELKDILNSVKTNGFFKTSIISDKDKQCIKDYNSLIDAGVKSQKKLEQATKGASDATKQMIKNANGNKIALDKMTIGAKATSVAMKTLSVAINMATMLAIAKVISLITEGIDNLAHSAEKCQERVDELMSAYESALTSANKNAKTVENLADRYEELSKGVDGLGKNVKLTNEEYEEYNSLVNDIADMFPTLVQGYTNEGNAILSLKGNVEQLRDAYKEAQQEAHRLLIVSGEDSDGNDIITNWKNLHETTWNGKLFDLYNDEVGKGISKSDALEQLKKLSNSTYEEYNNTLREDFWANGYSFYLNESVGLTFNATREQFEQVKTQAKALVQTYNAELESGLSNIKSLANAYLETNSSYKNIEDEGLKNAVSILVNSIDAEIASQFEKKEDVGAYVQSIMDSITDNKDGIQTALVSLFTEDFSSMPIETANSKIDKYIKSIANSLGENEIEIKARLGFENYDEIANSYKTMLEESSKKVSGAISYDIRNKTDKYYEYEEIYNKIDEFAKEHSLNTQDEIAAFYKALEESNNDIDKAFEKYLLTNKNDSADKNILSDSQIEAIEKAKSQVKSLQEALISLKNGELKSDEILSLITEFPELASEIDNLEPAINDVINSIGFSLLKTLNDVENSWDIVSLFENLFDEDSSNVDSLTNSLKDQLSYYDKVLSAVERRYDKEIDAIDDAIDAIEKENEALEEQLDNYDAIISTVVDFYEGQKDSLQDKIDGIEKENDLIQDQIDEYDGLLNAVTLVFDEEHSALESEQKLLDDRINALQEENVERDKALELEKAKYELARAQSQRTKKVYTNSEGFVYRADDVAVSDARDTVADLEFEATIDALEKEKELLQDIIDRLDEAEKSWGKLSTSFEDQKALGYAESLLGGNFKDIILNANPSVIEDYTNRYSSAQKTMEDNESTIEAIEAEMDKYDELIEKWESIATIREKLINQELTVQELGVNWKEMLLNDEAQVYEDFKDDYLAIQDAVLSNEEEIKSLEEKKLKYEELKQEWTDLKDEYTQHQEDMAAEQELGKDYENEILNGRIKNWEDFRDKYIGLQEEIAKATATTDGTVSITATTDTSNLPKHHTGLDKGYVGSSTSDNKRLEILRKAGNGDLASDEVPVILQRGELVLTKSQQMNISDALLQNAMMPSAYIPDYSYLKNFVPRNNTPTTVVNMGGVHLHEVQNVPDFAKALQRHLPNISVQYNGKH